MADALPPVFATVAAVRAAVAGFRAAGERVALVPTMGALHEGHLSLVTAARARARRVLVSIFVNPTQFAPHEDFSAYPRTFEADRAMLASVGADGVFAPQVGEMYPSGFATTVSLAGPAAVGLEDRFRPTHFAGVATVVAKLFTQVGPDVAVFGEKDYQQLAVVRRMAFDLDLPVEVVGAATVREADGLAMSSRNRYLAPAEREAAALVPRVMGSVAAAVRDGTPSAVACATGVAELVAAGFAVDYLELRDAETLAPDPPPERPRRLLVAAKIGRTRLIDNRGV